MLPPTRPIPPKQYDRPKPTPVHVNRDKTLNGLTYILLKETKKLFDVDAAKSMIEERCVLSLPN